MIKDIRSVTFLDSSGIHETPGIQSRATVNGVQAFLRHAFPQESMSVTAVTLNKSGTWRTPRLLGAIHRELPHFYEIVIEHRTGEFTQEIRAWCPLRWNERFAGTAGGGTCTGGVQQINQATNLNRGWTLPYAIRNGFSAATGDARSIHLWHDNMLDPISGNVRWELYENWRVGTTHWMTVIGRAVTEYLHDRPVRYAYMNGGSGGGRQSMMEAQEYPMDYDGIWASCPAIYWPQFLCGGLWPIAVMNSHHHVLGPEKMQLFAREAQQAAGGRDAYLRRVQRVEFDPLSIAGQHGITLKDAQVMADIWRGPFKENGGSLWYGYRPGNVFWFVGVPIGLHYPLIGRKPRNFIVVTQFMRWVTENPKQAFDNVTMEEAAALLEQSVAKFPGAVGGRSDLSSFADSGGKLIVDHGTDDPLIPVDDSIHYYQSVIRSMGAARTDDFFRLYITPGDGHGSCDWHGSGLTESTGITALMDWVEKGVAPEALPTVRVDRKARILLEERRQQPYHIVQRS